MEIINMFGFNSERNFYFNKVKNSELKFEWNSDTHGNFGNTSFTAYDSTIITTSLSGRVTSFNLSNGKKTGELKYDGEIEQAVIINNIYLIFIVNEFKERYSTLIIYDFKNAKEVLAVKLNGKYNNEMLLVDKYIYIVSDFGEIYKITTFGSIEWKIDLKKEIHSNPASDGNALYVATLDGSLMKLGLNNGEIIFSKNITNSFQSGLSIDGNTAYIGNNDGILYSIETKNGEVNWSFVSSSKIVQTPGFDNENVYFGNLNGDIYSIDKKSSILNWIRNSNGLINSSSLIFENIIIQPNLFMKLEILDKSTGKLLNQINYDSRVRTMPFFFRERIIIGVDKGELYCYSFENDLDEVSK
jgi:outer membrane protein assembly factor BamB